MFIYGVGEFYFEFFDVGVIDVGGDVFDGGFVEGIELYLWRGGECGARVAFRAIRVM